MLIGQAARQLQECERIARGLGEQPVPDPWRCLACPAGKNLSGRLIGEPGKHEFSQASGLETGCLTLARAEEDRQPLGPQAPRGEHQRVSGRPVQPLGVVHHTDHGTVLGGHRQQTKHRDRDQQAIGIRGRRHTERTGQRLGLDIRQLSQAAKNRPQQLVQPGERQVGLGLHPAGREHPHRPRVLPRVAKQRRLADPRLTPHHQRAATTRAGVVQQPVDGRALSLSSEQPRARKLRRRPRHSAHGSPCGDCRPGPRWPGDRRSQWRSDW